VNAAQTWLVNGTVVDGTGTPARPMTVVIQGSAIEAVLPPGELAPDWAQVVDVAGQVVAPGFIDTHSHADNVPFLAEDDTSKIEQGVTTEVVGNCGFSLAPVSPAEVSDFETLMGRIFPPMQYPWRSFVEFLELADSGGYVTHYAPLVGHNVLRIAAFGSAGRAPERDELHLMGALLEEALEAGAFGLSSGLIYPPGLFAAEEELGFLTARLGRNGVYATHMRNESAHLRDSVDEAVRTAAVARTRLHVSHLKVADRALWGSMGQVLAILDAAREDGLPVTQDAYPYTAGSTMLSAVLPPWFHDGGSEAVLARLHSAEALERAQRDLAEPGSRFENLVRAAGWDNIVISSTASHRYEGLTVAELARELGMDPLPAAARLLIEEHLSATMVMHMMDESDVETVLAHDHTAIGSDGLPPGTGGRPHPRTFGTFPRVLGRYVRERSVLPLAEAIRRMTSLPADIFGLTDRGRIQRGQAADIVCFDPETVNDQATYAEPTHSPVGVHRVYQNGQLTVLDGTWQGRRVGRRLTPGR
jgi:N-acyl-D-amino-acid deacylase